MRSTILITGASSGIGKAAAKYFQAKGWNVIATMRKPENETELNQLDNVLVTRLDVLDEQSISSATDEAIKKFGRIDVLLNNAGYGAYGPLEAFPAANITKQFDTNVIGLLSTTRAVLPYFRKQRSGLLINVSSVGGKITFPLGSLYHGTKFAVEGITEALNFELNAIGAKAKIIEPGAIRTDFAGRSFDFQNDESLTEYQDLVQKMMTVMASAMEANASDPEVVAEVIYQAATDGTDRLRYTAGEDARKWMADRRELDDETFTSGTRQMVGI